MITDHIRNRHLYYGIAPEIRLALDYCAEMYEKGFRETDDAIAENVTMKCHPLTTRPMSECKWEAHHRAADIHFITDGREVIGYADRTNLTVTDDRPDSDIMFLEGTAIGGFVTLEAGYFMLTFPDDAHAPCLSDGDPVDCNKIVAKIFL